MWFSGERRPSDSWRQGRSALGAEAVFARRKPSFPAPRSLVPRRPSPIGLGGGSAVAWRSVVEPARGQAGTSLLGSRHGPPCKTPPDREPGASTRSLESSGRCRAPIRGPWPRLQRTKLPALAARGRPPEPPVRSDGIVQDVGRPDPLRAGAGGSEIRETPGGPESGRRPAPGPA